MLLTDTAKTKETALQKKLIEKRNLFGLGVTSLIAACSADGAGGDTGDGGESDFTSTLPFKAKELLEPENLAEAKKLEGADAGGYSAPRSGSATSLTVEVEKPAGTTQATLNFSNASDNLAKSDIYKLTTPGQYDLVISIPFIDNRVNNLTEYQKGKIFIYWNVAEVMSATDLSLEITGAALGDRIGKYAPEFLELDSATGGGYDMVIRSDHVEKSNRNNTLSNEGAIYILWDIKSYHESAITGFDLSDAGLRANTGATSGSLAIYGAKASDYIGTHAPDFLQLGGVAGDKLDMVIRSEDVDNKGTGENNSNTNEGAIYVLWDVVDYYQDVSQTDRMLRNKTIDLGADDGDPNYATAGLLTIYGARKEDQIGAHTPEFLQLGGKDKNYDMVIRSERWIDSNGDGENDVSEAEVSEQAGAIYVLWDINDYYKDADDAIANKRIDLEVGSDDSNYATSGLLTIKGAKTGDKDADITGDWIGINPLEFLQLGKKNDKYDMVIRSEHVDNGSAADTGAIYVLWDVADYTADKNKSINLTSLSDDATSGLLTIYGATGNSMLGSSDILYRADNEDSDVDGDTTNDLVFKDNLYTYVLFGDQLGAVNADTGKVASKTIDLSQIQVDAKGFFGNDVDKELGYRFATDTGSDGSAGYTTFKQVQDAFPKPAGATLSDADADLGVWDIA